MPPMPAGAAQAPGFDGGRAQRFLRLALGCLWLLDAALQLQPGMFTRSLVTVVWAPALQGQPEVVARLMRWAIALVSPHLVAFNWAIVVIQAGIGALLLAGGHRRARVGPWASLTFSLLVWVVGQGLGQVLTGSASILSGAPGSVLVYALASALLLMPGRSWSPRRPGDDPVSRLLAVLLWALAALQLSPTFWTATGLAAPFGQGFMMPQPAFLRAWISAASGLATAAPVALNAALVVALAAVGVALLRPGRDGRVGLWAALALLGLVWVFGQDAGMLFSGMATDPNSAPALAALAGAALAGRTRSTLPGATSASAGRGAHGAPPGAADPVAVTATGQG
jgi:hypothetical protein